MNNPFFDCIKNLYTKRNFNWIENFYEQNFAIGLIQVLKKNNDNLESLKKIIKYIYVLKPDNLLILLHVIIPKVYKIPYFGKKIKIQKDKDEELHKKIQKYFGYSDKEYKIIKRRVSEIINKNLKEYYIKFGIKIKKRRD